MHVSLVKCQSLDHFFIRLVAFLLLSSEISLYILDTEPTLGTSFANIFLEAMVCLLILSQ